MIYTKVAKVLNSTSVILAAGTEDGVKEGMEFIIYDLSETIRDPDTGEDLGQLEIVKGRVYAVHVQEKMTWAQTRSRTVQRTTDPTAAFRAALAAVQFAKQTTTETVWDQLKVAEHSPIHTTDLTVRVGDKARSVYQAELALTDSDK